MHKKRIRQKIGKREKLKGVECAKVMIFPIMGMMAAQSAALLSRISAMVGVHPIARAAQMTVATTEGMLAMMKAHEKGKEWVALAESQ